jgi:ATP-dependent Zn protease
MNRPMRGLRRESRRAIRFSLSVLTLCLALALLAPAVSASGPTATIATATIATATATHFQRESFKAFEGQLATGQIKAATFNKKAHTLHLSLKDGRHMLVSYPSHEEPQLAAKLLAKGVPVTIEKKKAKPKTAVHHTLRYIAGGIVVVVFVVVVAVLLVDRRRKLNEGGQDTPASSASSSSSSSSSSEDSEGGQGTPAPPTPGDSPAPPSPGDST